MSIQRASWVTPTVSGGVVSPSAVSVITMCGSPKVVARLYVRLTTAQCSDANIITWLSALRNSGFLSVWACTPMGVQTWAQAANHATAVAWMDAACGMKHTPFLRMIQGILFDIRPWRLGGSWNQTSKADYLTLQSTLWAQATDFSPDPNIYNPSGNASLLMANTIAYNMHDMTVDIASVPKVIDRRVKGHQQVILANQYDFNAILPRMYPHLSSAKTVPWQNITLALTVQPNGSADVPDAASTLDTLTTENAINIVLNALETRYESTQEETKLDFLAVDDIALWDAKP